MFIWIPLTCRKEAAMPIEKVTSQEATPKRESSKGTFCLIVSTRRWTTHPTVGDSSHHEAFRVHKIYRA